MCCRRRIGCRFGGAGFDIARQEREESSQHQPSDGVASHYTRDSNFIVDGFGNINQASTGFHLQGYGLVTHFQVPGDFEVQLYQPRYTRSARVS